MHILVVEDDPAGQALLVQIARRPGSTVDSASDGATAIRLLRQTDYALVLLDLMLPEINGFEMLREMQACRPHLLKRTIVVTAASDRTLRDFDDRKVFRMFRKPFDLIEFQDALRECAVVARHDSRSARRSVNEAAQRAEPSILEPCQKNDNHVEHGKRDESKRVRVGVTVDLIHEEQRKGDDRGGIRPSASEQ